MRQAFRSRPASPSLVIGSTFVILGRSPVLPILVTVEAGRIGILKLFPVAANAIRPSSCNIWGMAIYRVITDPFFSASFAAEVTFRNGYVETQHGLLTQGGALDWASERLVVDQDPASEA
jgi:hypothetical protein